MINGPTSNARHAYQSVNLAVDTISAPGRLLVRLPTFLDCPQKGWVKVDEKLSSGLLLAQFCALKAHISQTHHHAGRYFLLGAVRSLG